MKSNLIEDSRSKSIFWVLFNNYIALPLNVVYNIFSKKILGELAPKLTSDAILAGSFHKYFDIAFFPFVSSLSREIPLYRDNDPEYAKRITNVVFTISFLLSALAFIFFILLGYFTDNLILKLIYYAFSFASIFKFIHRTINVYLGAYGQFIRKSKISLWVSLIKLPVNLALIYYFLDIGYVISMFFTMGLVGFFFIFLMDWKKVSLVFDYSIIKLLMIRAIPFTLYMGIETIIFTFDKFLIRNISQIELGIYGFAFQVSFMIYETPKMIYATLFPFYVRDLKDKILPSVFYKITNVQSRILLFTSVIIIFAHSVFVLLVKFYLPYFDGAQIYASVLFLIPYVYSFNYVFYLYCISKRHDRGISVISLISIGLAVLLFAAAYFYNFSALQISIIVVFVLFVNSSQILYFLTNKYKLESSRIFKLYGFFVIFLLPYGIVCLPSYVKDILPYSFLVTQVLFLMASIMSIFILIRIFDPSLPGFIYLKLKEAVRSKK